MKKNNSSIPQMPECRYCKSVTHSSKEWDKCVKAHSNKAITSFDPFEEISYKLVKDCSRQELMISLQKMCPEGLIIASPADKSIHPTGEVEVLFSGYPLTLLRISQSISSIVISSFFTDKPG